MLAVTTDEKDSLRAQDIEGRRHLKDIEDELIDVLVVLDSLHDTVDALLDNYTEYVRSSSQLYTGDYDTSSRAFQAQMKDIDSSRKNVHSLQTKMQGITSFLSNLLALRNHASLRQIAQEERRENAILRRLNEKGADDSSAVKVLTIIILIYLPITVVCVRILANLPKYLTPVAARAWSNINTTSLSSPPNSSAYNRASEAVSSSWLRIHGCSLLLQHP